MRRPNDFCVLVSRIQQIDMAALGSDLTCIQGMEIFEFGLHNVIRSPGKVNGSPGSKSLAELLPKDTPSLHIDQVDRLLGYMAKNGFSLWTSALESAGITIIKVNKSLKRKISYKHRMLPNIPLTSCIPNKKKDLPIITLLLWNTQTSIILLY